MSISVLVSREFTLLQYLSLSECCLSASAVKELTEHNWPNLRGLDLKRNRLDTESFYHFLQGVWPKRQSGKAIGRPQGLINHVWPKLKVLKIFWSAAL